MGQGHALTGAEDARLFSAASEEAGARAARQAGTLTRLFMVGTHAEIVAALSELGPTAAVGVELLLLHLERLIPAEERGG
ncbi:MAG: hypothetical protein ACJ74Q_15255 [Pyrinomonadaceae bacterium]